jgi:hypothetical protein
MRYRMSRRKPSPASVRFLAICAIQPLDSSGAMPTICTRLDRNRSDGAPMRLQESPPGRPSTSLGGWFQAGVGQNALDGVSADLVAQIEQSTADPRVSPAGLRILHISIAITLRS